MAIAVIASGIIISFPQWWQLWQEPKHHETTITLNTDTASLKLEIQNDTIFLKGNDIIFCKHK